MTDNTVKVWDPLVRVLHWSLVAAVLTAYILAEENRQFHEIAGLAMVLIVTLRSAWGLFGPATARFSSFVPTPAAALAYLGSLRTGHPQRYLGHNPAGGAMIIALFAVLLATALTGVLTVRGVLPRELGGELHELLGTAVMVLAGLHVLGVVMSSRLHQENLAKAMVTGRKAQTTEV